YDILPDVNKNIIRRNFWHGKTKLITLSAIYPAPCQQSGKDGFKRGNPVLGVSAESQSIN
ncbi:MAG: hypothetical protein WAW09_02715, partial [Smithella sp.]